MKNFMPIIDEKDIWKKEIEVKVSYILAIMTLRIIIL